MERTRSRTRPVQVVGHHYGVYFDGSRFAQGDEPVTYTTGSRMTDIVVPSFFKRRAAGDVIVNNMTSAHFSVTPSAGSFICSGKPNDKGQRMTWVSSPVYWGSSLEGNLAGWPKVGDLVEHASGLAITDAAAAVNKGNVESLVTLAEAHETISFMLSPLKAAASLTRRAVSWEKRYWERERQFRARKERFDALPTHKKEKRTPPKAPTHKPFKVGKFEATTPANMWLAYRYGIRPLIAEFKAYEKQLADKGRPARETARGFSSESGSDTKETDLGVTGNPSGTGSIHVSRRQTLDYQVACRAGFLYEVDWTFQKQLGLTLDRVPAAVYEAIPYSFVADWIWNGSAFYDAVTASLRAKKILGGWVVNTISYTYTDAQRWVSADPHTSVGNSNWQVMTTEVGTVKVRSPRSLADVKLAFRVRLNTQRIVDGFALLQQLFSGRRKK